MSDQEPIKIPSPSVPATSPESDQSDLPYAVGKISEIIPDVSSVAANSQLAQGNTDETQQATHDTGQIQATSEDRNALRERLLRNAPSEPVMRKEVKAALEKKQLLLEKVLKKAGRRMPMHILSETIAQLRAIIIDLKSIADMSLERLKEFWLSLTHNFT